MGEGCCGPRRLKELFLSLKASRSWLLSLYYFLTFGGFVAMAIYLPIFLSDIFRLSPEQAGMRTAEFAVLATVLRPVGGTLADKVGGKRILIYVFSFTILMVVILAIPMNNTEFFIDYSRCIGCDACVQACAKCNTHRGVSMIHPETIAPRESVQTAPQICMHFEEPSCAQVFPADAIKKTPDGVVQSSLKPRCIGCSNCVMACPCGVPKYEIDIDKMMKSDMCYDRSSVGKKPMCATVCPSGALTYTTVQDIQFTRRGIPINEWNFGGEIVRTKV